MLECDASKIFKPFQLPILVQPHAHNVCKLCNHIAMETYHVTVPKEQVKIP